MEISETSGIDEFAGAVPNAKKPAAKHATDVNRESCLNIPIHTPFKQHSKFTLQNEKKAPEAFLFYRQIVNA